MLSRALSLATVMLLIGCFAAGPALAQAKPRGRQEPFPDFRGHLHRLPQEPARPAEDGAGVVAAGLPAPALYDQPRHGLGASVLPDFQRRRRYPFCQRMTQIRGADQPRVGQQGCDAGAPSRRLPSLNGAQASRRSRMPMGCDRRAQRQAAWRGRQATGAIRQNPRRQARCRAGRPSQAAERPQDWRQAEAEQARQARRGTAEGSDEAQGDAAKADTGKDEPQGPTRRREKTSKPKPARAESKPRPPSLRSQAEPCKSKPAARSSRSKAARGRAPQGDRRRVAARSGAASPAPAASGAVTAPSPPPARRQPLPATCPRPPLVGAVPRSAVACRRLRPPSPPPCGDGRRAAAFPRPQGHRRRRSPNEFAQTKAHKIKPGLRGPGLVRSSGVKSGLTSLVAVFCRQPAARRRRAGLPDRRTRRRRRAPRRRRPGLPDGSRCLRRG